MRPQYQPKAPAPRDRSANEVFESLEAAVEISRRVVADLPALSAIILGRGEASRAPMGAKIVSADRWLSSTIVELEQIELRVTPRSRQNRARELLEETRGLHLVVKDRLQRMEQLWGSPADALRTVPRLAKGDLDQLHGDMTKFRVEFWQRLFAIPCVARERVSEISRCLAGEVGIKSEIFTISTETRSDEKLLSEIRKAVGFFDKHFGADGQGGNRHWIALGKMLAKLPCLPEAALERAKAAEERGRELESLSLAIGCRDDAQRQAERRRAQQLLEDDLGGGVLQCRADLKRLADLQAAYLELRNYICLANMGLAASFAQLFVEAPHNQEDLHQASLIGLLKGVERFDPAQGSSFSTFTGYWIRQMCIDERGSVRAHVKVPGYARHFYMALLHMPDEIARSIDMTQAAKEFSLKPKVARAVQQVALGIRRFGDSRGRAEGEPSVAEALADHRVSEATQLGQQREAKEFTETLMRKLGAREQEIIKLRFGIGGSDPLTFREIAERLGLTRERVRQIVEEVLERFRGGDA